MSPRAPRRAFLASALGLGLPARAQPMGPMPTLHVVVTAESMHPILPSLTKFALSHSDLVREVVIERQEPSWLLGAFAREVRAGRPPAEVVLAGTTGLMLGATRELWQPLPARLRNAGGAMVGHRTGLMLPVAGAVGLVISATAGGPILLHSAQALPRPPRTALELLDYARENPGRFLYPRPSLSAFGRLFASALPYLLQDAAPADPQAGWDRTWSYLAELGRHVDYYPTSGTAALEELAEGGCDLLPGLLLSWVREREAGRFSEDIAVDLLDPAPLIPLGLFLLVPRGVSAECLPVIEALAEFLLQADIQRMGFGRGILPGEPGGLGIAEEDHQTPAELTANDRRVPASLAARIAAQPLAPPLDPDYAVYMLRRWDEQIGARFGQP